MRYCKGFMAEHRWGRSHQSAHTKHTTDAHSRPLFLSLSLSLTHTRIHTHTHTHTHSHTHTHTYTPPLGKWLTHTSNLTLFLPLSLTHPLTHTHTHTPPVGQWITQADGSDAKERLRQGHNSADKQILGRTEESTKHKTQNKLMTHK